MFAWWRRRRRAAVRARPFPPEWRAIIVDNVPLFSRLPAADQVELIGHTQVLLAEKRFVGCGGLALTDEIRVTIAAQAAVLARIPIAHVHGGIAKSLLVRSGS